MRIKPTVAASLFISAVFSAAGLPSSAKAQEWTRFRGPNGAGQSDATTIPTSWTQDDFRWKIDLPGIGHSSPVLWGEKLFVTAGDRDTGELIILCVDATTGKTIWTKRLPSGKQRMHRRNSYASGTPAVTRDRLYLAWATPDDYKVVAMDHEGKELWQESLGPFKSQHGFCTSPIVHDDMVILPNSQQGESFIVALDQDTGATRWKLPRKSKTAAYSTPCIYQPAGRRPELIFDSDANGVTSVNPATGTVNWELDIFPLRPVSSPFVAGGLIFGTCGVGTNGRFVIAVRPPDGAGKPAEKAYEITKAVPYLPTPVAYDDMVFLWSDKGIVTCIDAATGNVHWQERVPGSFTGSPVRVGERIFCMSDDGEVVVIAAAKKFELLAQNPVGGRTQATPAVALGRMYLRTTSSLVCIGGEK